MGMVIKQFEFVRDVLALVQFAIDQGFIVTFGEVFRPIEMQKIYIQTGRSLTMNSQHLDRLAIDLNFFKYVNGKLTLIYSIKELTAIGEFWEALNPKNRAGMFFNRDNPNGWKDVPHFERED